MRQRGGKFIQRFHAEPARGSRIPVRQLFMTERMEHGKIRAQDAGARGTEGSLNAGLEDLIFRQCRLDAAVLATPVQLDPSRQLGLEPVGFPGISQGLQGANLAVAAAEQSRLRFRQLAGADRNGEGAGIEPCRRVEPERGSIADQQGLDTPLVQLSHQFGEARAL